MVDFGVSKNMSSLQSTKTRGNDRFKCPEHETNKVSPKGDIWSFGTLILYMLSAQNSSIEFLKIDDFLLHERIKSLLNEPEDCALKEALLKMIVSDPD